MKLPLNQLPAILAIVILILNKINCFLRKLLYIIFLLLSAILPFQAFCQWVTVSGTVFDITKKTPMEYVSVLSIHGQGTTTDSLGHYEITVRENDSIYFSFLNKPTPKYAVKNIANMDAFNISIQKKIGELPGVTIKQRNYKLDSMHNREEYGKIFNYKKPGIGITINPGMAAGLDLDEFIKIFQFKKNRRMLSFQKRLLREEQDGYINHRFSKGLVKKLTGLDPPAIESFMVEYRPTLMMVEQMNDLELGQFIIEAYKYFKDGIKVNKQLFNREVETDE